MRCPVCGKRMGGNLYGAGLMCPGCGYVEPPEEVLKVEVDPEPVTADAAEEEVEIEQEAAEAPVRPAGHAKRFAKRKGGESK